MKYGEFMDGLVGRIPEFLKTADNEIVAAALRAKVLPLLFNDDIEKWIVAEAADRLDRKYPRPVCINLILHWFGHSEFVLCAQLPIWHEPTMNKITEGLRQLVPAKNGLGYTEWFRFRDYDLIQEWFLQKGYQVQFVDKRKESIELHNLCNPENQVTAEDIDRLIRSREP